MGKLFFNHKVPASYDRFGIGRIFEEIQNQVNGLAEGQLSASYSAQASMPTTGNYAQGDFVRNALPEENGESGSKYVVTGWLCVAPPSTFVEQRCLTGN